MVPWIAYRALPPGAWQPTDRNEVPDLDLFPTERPVDQGYLEFAKAFRILFPDFTYPFDDIFPGEGGEQGQRTPAGQDFFRL
eukprot:5733982-Lingulodinium_polyedra.AAC.1